MRSTAVLLIAGALLTACSSGNHAGVVQMTNTSRVIETVNGTPVPASLLDAVARQHNLSLDNAAARDQALNLLTDMVIVAQTAQHEPFASDENYQAEIEAARLKAVADTTFGRYEQMTSVSDDVLKAEYDAESAKVAHRIYDFGQLLFADENEAMNAEADLLGGKSFAEVFDAYRAKAKQAKVYTRVRPDQIPDALAKALDTLKDGESTKLPVKTEYGYHVVHLDSVSPFTPPPFEQVKDSVRRTTQVKVAQERMKKLREAAKIEYPTGSAPPAADKKG